MFSYELNPEGYFRLKKKERPKEEIGKEKIEECNVTRTSGSWKVGGGGGTTHPRQKEKNFF